MSMLRLQGEQKDICNILIEMFWLLHCRAACYNTIGQFSRAIEDYNIALLKDQVTLSIHPKMWWQKRICWQQGPSKIDSRTDLRRRSSNEPLGRKNVDAANISSRGFNEFNGVDLEMMSKTRSQFSGFELEKISSQPFPLCKGFFL